MKLLLLSASALLLAHHSFGAEYDANKPFTMSGTIAKIEWTNPHTHMYVEVKDPAGTGDGGAARAVGAN